MTISSREVVEKDIANAANRITHLCAGLDFKSKPMVNTVERMVAVVQHKLSRFHKKVSPVKTLDVSAIFLNSSMDNLDSTAALIKLGEEYGELCSAHLNEADLANKSASSSPNTDEEAVDIILCAVDYLAKKGRTVEEINEIINVKSNKWFNKIRKSLETSEKEN